MKVDALVEALAQLDPGIDVLCYLETDEDSQIFEILSVDVVEAEKSRVDGMPRLKFEKSEYSEPHAFINVTVDF